MLKYVKVFTMLKFQPDTSAEKCWILLYVKYYNHSYLGYCYCPYRYIVTPLFETDVYFNRVDDV